jgi:hypothetical protein
MAAAGSPELKQVLIRNFLLEFGQRPERARSSGEESQVT